MLAVLIVDRAVSDRFSGGGGGGGVDLDKAEGIQDPANDSAMGLMGLALGAVTVVRSLAGGGRTSSSG